jgi:hypothetical protein
MYASTRVQSIVSILQYHGFGMHQVPVIRRAVVELMLEEQARRWMLVERYKDMGGNVTIEKSGSNLCLLDPERSIARRGGAPPCLPARLSTAINQESPLPGPSAAVSYGERAEQLLSAWNNS